MPNPNESKLSCPFIGRWCIEHKCMMWVSVSIVKDGKPDIIKTCCIPLQLQTNLNIQNELIRTQSDIDKLNNTLASIGGRVTAILHRMAENNAKVDHSLTP